MSEKKNLQKKYNQAARREIRRELSVQMRVWEKALKPKPKFMPLFMFNWMRNLTIKTEFFNKYEVGQD